MLSKVEDAPMDTELSFEAETDGVLVRVSPQFVDEESSPERNHYVWAYHVEIENHGSRTLKLETRRWCITDRDGRVQDVEGPGVVGQHPEQHEEQGQQTKARGDGGQPHSKSSSRIWRRVSMMPNSTTNPTLAMYTRI